MKKVNEHQTTFGFSKKIHVALSLLLISNIGFSQYQVREKDTRKFPWPEGKLCAVSLSFDDARSSQVDKGVPLFNSYGVKATFYITPDSLPKRLDAWKKANNYGHEIGNHTTSHPCTGSYAFSFGNALENYTLAQMEDDIKNANNIIQSQLGINTVSFAYPCGQKFVGTGENVQSYVPLIAKNFASGRGWLGEAANNPWICDFAQLLGMESDGKSFEQLKALIEQARSEGAWLILAGHEINTKGLQTTQIQELEELLRYMNNPENGVWIGTVAEIAHFVKNNR
jgi:peptidoglycan/xylan/chitin deacetylase (PgdA/CDA1 family)